MPSAASARLSGRSLSAGAAGRRLAGSGVSAVSKTGSSNWLQKSGPGHSPATSRRHAILPSPSSSRRRGLLDRHGDVDGNRRERADLALVARHAPLLLPQQPLFGAAILAAAARARLDAFELEAEVGRDGHLRLDANRPLEPAAERDGHTLQRQRRDLEALELQPRANRPGRKPEADQREQQRDGGDRVALGDLARARAVPPATRSGSRARRSRSRRTPRVRAEPAMRPFAHSGRQRHGSSGNCSRSFSSAAIFLAAYARAEQEPEARRRRTASANTPLSANRPGRSSRFSTARFGSSGST